jgi:hypothetical protein
MDNPLKLTRLGHKTEDEDKENKAKQKNTTQKTKNINNKHPTKNPGVNPSDYLHVNDRDFEKLELDKIITKTYQTAIYSQCTQVFE